MGNRNLPTLTRESAGDLMLTIAARQRAQTTPRSLRHVCDDEDMVIMEDRETGERRRLPNKFVIALGNLVAFELADPESLMEESHG